MGVWIVASQTPSFSSSTTSATNGETCPTCCSMASPGRRSRPMIGKCAIRCGNCHRRETARDLGLYERKRMFVKVEEPQATYGWLLIGDSRAVSSVDRAEVF